MGRRTVWAFAVMALLAPVAARPEAVRCSGDCNGNGAVAINELVTMVTVAMDASPLSACAAGDIDGNGAISVEEIVTAVTVALAGCASVPSPTPTLMACTGADLTTCAAACGGPGRDGCCPLSNPPACFDSTNGSISFTQCGSQPSTACVLGSNATPTRTAAGVPSTPTATPGGPTPPPTATAAPGARTQVSIVNQTGAATRVYVNFGADSAITQPNWASFCAGSGLNCQFTLLGNGAAQVLPNPSGAYLNATFSFDMALACGVTKAEVNVNNPSWYDVLDVSLVDGFSNKVAIIAMPTNGTPIQLGPPVGQTGNETAYGVYPYGCDVCVARCNPPCDIPRSSPLLGCNASCDNCQGNGVDGCKAGTQSAPAVPCQYQATQIGGGGETVQVVLMP